jgi:hypothetical protein
MATAWTVRGEARRGDENGGMIIVHDHVLNGQSVEVR